MPFFPFGRKVEFTKEYSLEEIPLFSSLTPPERRLIEKKMRLVEFKRGDVIYEEGTPADAFYVVVSGRLRLFLKGRSGGFEQTLIYFYRGDHFGETSLLTGQLHSASVEAKRDGLLLRLDKEDFLKLVSEIPAISLHLNRSMGHRLSRSMDHVSARREVKITALYSKEKSPASFQFWLDFAGSTVAASKRKVIIVDFVQSEPSLVKEEFQSAFKSFELSVHDPSREADLKTITMSHKNGFDYLHVHTNGDRDEKKVSTLLTFLTYRYEYLMLRLPKEMSDFSFKALKHSDTVYVYCGAQPGELTGCAQTVQELQQGFSFGKNEIRVIVELSGKTGSFEETESLVGLRIFSYLPSKTEKLEQYERVMRYLARELSGKLLGLALGSGAAYGLAHIGVLRVLEREGIHADIVSGSSIGALVGALWASGLNTEELERMAKSIDKRSGFFKLLGLQDISLAHKGFFKGHQVTRFLESYLGNRNFQDLQIPCKIVAANLFTSEEVVLETGRVVDAIRASISIPGIFRPVLHQNQYMIDGGVLDPLPIGVLTSMGVKKIIAVNVLPGPKDRIERNVVREEIYRRKKEEIAHQNIFKRMIASGMDRLYNRYALNIFNVIMNTIQFMEYELAEASATHADILIHPIVKEAHWAEFYSPDKFIKIGEQRTEEQLEEIKKLIAE